jgi:uncharacterized protein YjiS (DUF1127 family)
MMTQPQSDFAMLVAADGTLFPRAVVASLLRTLNAHWEDIRAGRDLAARYDKLTRMSRSELASRGLSRQDIARAAVTGHAA